MKPIILLVFATGCSFAAVRATPKPPPAAQPCESYIAPASDFALSLLLAFGAAKSFTTWIQDDDGCDGPCHPSAAPTTFIIGSASVLALVSAGYGIAANNRCRARLQERDQRPRM